MLTTGSDSTRAAPAGGSDTIAGGPDEALECRGLRKTYPGEQGFSLGAREGGVSFTVGRGELFALVGPSGCGKTTTLRIIGGFVSADEGSVLIDGVDVTGRPPYARPTNTVFQSYALFPHMSVGANVAFGLTMERVGRKEKEIRVAEALALVGLEGLEKSRVSEFSGGQQQRVALARAMVKRPAVLLLDEPLGALDLKLRKQMQDELARLKSSSSTTFIHVTHDQEEACAIADRIAVMKEGQIVQVDHPFSLYRNPCNTFVSSFLDAGTIVRGRVSRRGDVVEIACPEVTVRTPVRAGLTESDSLAAVIPPDRVQVADASAGPAGQADAHGTVVRVVFTGTVFVSYVRVEPELEIKISLSADKVAAVPKAIETGAQLAVSWDPKDVILVEDSEGDGASKVSAPA